MFRKTLALLGAIGLVAFPILAETSYPKGGYMSLKELIDKTPSSHIEVTIYERSNSDISMNGGNRYKIVPKDGITKKRHFKKDAIAYSSGDHLYFNCKSIGHQNWYSRVKSEGRLLLFFCQTPNGEIIMAQVAGGVIASSIVAGKGALVAIDSENGRTIRINKTIVPSLLQPFPALLESFEGLKGRDRRNLDYQYMYLEDLNAEYAKESQDAPLEENTDNQTAPPLLEDTVPSSEEEVSGDIEDGNTDVDLIEGEEEGEIKEDLPDPNLIESTPLDESKPTIDKDDKDD